MTSATWEELSYSSFTSLKEAHAELLQRRRSDGDAPALLDDVTSFIVRGRATGALLDDDDERGAAQSLLTYWANLLYRTGRLSPDPTLADFDADLAPDLPDALCPYLGLEAFREHDAKKFYGRNRLIAELVERLAIHPLLAVVGPSGSGKSSLVRAGLIPALRAGALPGSENWCYLAPIVPGSDPLANLARLISDFVSPSVKGFRSSDEQLLLQLLLEGEIEPSPDTSGKSPQPTTYLQPLIDRLHDKNALHQIFAERNDAPVVLIIDQFEELFTLCHDEPTHLTFIQRLLELTLIPNQHYHIILTMRSDFEAFVARVPQLQALFEVGRVQATPLSASEMRDAIEQPAAAIALKFEAGVVDLLLQDILGEPAGLPLLQFTLLKLWEHREHNRVKRAIYDRVGGGRLALARCADELYADLIPEEQITARRLLLRLVRPGEGLEITSSRVRRADLYRSGEDRGRIDRVLDRLVREHLVRLTVDDTPNDTQVEIAHEALVRNWPTLVEWLEEERTRLRHRLRLTVAAEQWNNRGRDPSLLWRGVSLNDALQFDDVSMIEQDFVHSSVIAVERTKQEKESIRRRELAQAQALAVEQERRALAEFQRAEAQTQANIRLLYLAITLAILFILAVATSFIAQQQRRRAQSQALALRAQAELDPELGLELALAAAKRGRDAQVENVLQQALQRVRGSIVHGGRVTSAEWSPDDRYILTSSEDQTARIQDSQVITAPLLLGGHKGSVTSATWSPDGRHVLTASSDKTARIWNAATGATEHILSGHAGPITSAAWSPDGRYVLTASSDKTARIWDAATGTSEHILSGHAGPITSAAWSPDGRYVLTASEDQIAWIWDTATGASKHILSGHSGPITSIAWSPDGRYILTASFDRTVRIWEVALGTTIGILQGHEQGVTGLAWSADGKRILTASADRTARVWEAATGKQLFQPYGHTGSVSSIAWSPDGQRILTTSADKLLRIWNAADGKLISSFGGNEQAIVMAVWSDNGQQIVSAGADSTARIYYPDYGILLEEAQRSVDHELSEAEIENYLSGNVSILPTNTPTVMSVPFTPANTYTPSSRPSPTGTIPATSVTSTPVVTTPTGQTPIQINWMPLLTLEGHTDTVSDAEFSSDGRLIVTASWDGTARVWEASTGKVILELRGHSGPVYRAAFSPDGRFIVTASQDTTARIWDVVTGSTILVLRGHTDSVLSAAFSHDGKQIVTASVDNTARVWDALTGNTLTEITSHSSHVRDAAFSSNDKYVITASWDGTAQIRQVGSWNLLATLQHPVAIFGANFSTDGQIIVTAGSDGVARKWAGIERSDKGSELLPQLVGHRGQIRNAVFSSSGRFIATASDDGTAQIWDVKTSQSVTLQPEPAGIIYSVEFNHNENLIVVSSANGKAQIWRSGN